MRHSTVHPHTKVGPKVDDAHAHAREDIHITHAVARATSSSRCGSGIPMAYAVAHEDDGLEKEEDGDGYMKTEDAEGYVVALDGAMVGRNGQRTRFLDQGL